MPTTGWRRASPTTNGADSADKYSNSCNAPYVSLALVFRDFRFYSGRCGNATAEHTKKKNFLANVFRILFRHWRRVFALQRQNVFPPKTFAVASPTIKWLSQLFIHMKNALAAHLEERSLKVIDDLTTRRSTCSTFIVTRPAITDEGFPIGNALKKLLVF